MNEPTVYCLRQWEPAGPCYIRTIEGDLVKVKLIKEGNVPVKWETVPPFKKEEFDTKNYRCFSFTP